MEFDNLFAQTLFICLVINIQIVQYIVKQIIFSLCFLDSVNICFLFKVYISYPHEQQVSSFTAISKNFIDHTKMSEKWPEKRKKNKGFVGKSIEWYRVYETRLSINLLEPWEKVLANILVIAMVSLFLLSLLWIVKLIGRLILT